MEIKEKYKNSTILDKCIKIMNKGNISYKKINKKGLSYMEMDKNNKELF